MKRLSRTSPRQRVTDREWGARTDASAEIERIRTFSCPLYCRSLWIRNIWKTVRREDIKCKWATSKRRGRFSRYLPNRSGTRPSNARGEMTLRGSVPKNTMAHLSEGLFCHYKSSTPGTGKRVAAVHELCSTSLTRVICLQAILRVKFKNSPVCTVRWCM